MHVNPFIMGIFVTLFAELALMFILALINSNKH